VVAELDRSEDVLHAAGRRPHVVLLDPQLPGRIRIEDLCRKLTGPGVSLGAGTVRNYLSRILAKTGARSRIEAIRKGQDAGWI
jgi:hypothetical protein